MKWKRFSPNEAHEYDEILVLLDGRIDLELDDHTETLTGLTMKELPAGTRHVIHALETPTRIVIIHPNRIPE